jgi:putative transposase
MDLDGRAPPVRFLIHDRDSKFSGAPNANAVAERLLRTIRAECLDWTLVLGRRHLDRVLRAYEEHYNLHRPHRAISLATPEPQRPDPTPGDPLEVRRRDVLGGLIHEYYGVAA